MVFLELWDTLSGKVEREAGGKSKWKLEKAGHARALL